MDERHDRPLHVQRLVIKTDSETISKISQAYETLRVVHEENERRQREAGQRIADERCNAFRRDAMT